jgi:hypothetical protein
MLKKFILTSLVILIQPGTLAQLAFAFIVSLVFLACSSQINPFVKGGDNDYMFYSTLSTVITLFSGILLKANIQEDSTGGYEQALVTFILVACNLSVLVLFLLVMFKGKGGKSTGVDMKGRLMEKSQQVALEAAKDKATEYLEEIFEMLLDAIRSFEEGGPIYCCGIESDTMKLGDMPKMDLTSMKTLVESMLTSMKKKLKQETGKYGGEDGMKRLLDDVEKTLNSIDFASFANELLTIGAEFAGESGVSALTGMAVDLITGLLKELAGAEVSKIKATIKELQAAEGDHADEQKSLKLDISRIREDTDMTGNIVKIAGNLMKSSVRNRDVLVEKVREALTSTSLSEISSKLSELPFLICSQMETMLDLIAVIMKQITRKLLDNGVAAETCAVLIPLGKHAVKCAVGGELAVLSPLELVGTVQNVVVKAVSDPQAAKGILMGLARELLGDELTELVIKECRGSVLGAVCAAGQKAMQAADMSAASVALLGACGEEAKRMSSTACAEVVESITQLPDLVGEPDKLLESLKKTATTVLGSELVKEIMDAGVAGCLDALKDLISPIGDFTSGYPALVPLMALDAGTFVREKGGAAALQKVINDVTRKEGPARNAALVAASQKIMKPDAWTAAIGTLSLELADAVAAKMVEGEYSSTQISLLYAIHGNTCEKAEKSPDGPQTATTLAALVELATLRPSEIYESAKGVVALAEKTIGGPAVGKVLDEEIATAIASYETWLTKTVPVEPAYFTLAQGLARHSGSFTLRHGKSDLLKILAEMSSNTNAADAQCELVVVTEEVAAVNQAFDSLKQQLVDSVVQDVHVVLNDKPVDLNSDAIPDDAVDASTQLDGIKTEASTLASEQLASVLFRLGELARRGRADVLDAEGFRKALAKLAEQVLGAEYDYERGYEISSPRAKSLTVGVEHNEEDKI